MRYFKVVKPSFIDGAHVKGGIVALADDAQWSDNLVELNDEELRVMRLTEEEHFAKQAEYLTAQAKQSAEINEKNAEEANKRSTTQDVHAIRATPLLKAEIDQEIDRRQIAQPNKSRAELISEYERERLALGDRSSNVAFDAAGAAKAATDRKSAIDKAAADKKAAIDRDVTDKADATKQKAEVDRKAGADKADVDKKVAKDKADADERERARKAAVPAPGAPGAPGAVIPPTGGWGAGRPYTGDPSAAATVPHRSEVSQLPPTAAVQPAGFMSGGNPPAHPGAPTAPFDAEIVPKGTPSVRPGAPNPPVQPAYDASSPGPFPHRE